MVCGLPPIFGAPVDISGIDPVRLNMGLELALLALLFRLVGAGEVLRGVEGRGELARLSLADALKSCNQ